MNPTVNNDVSKDSPITMNLLDLSREFYWGH